MIPPLLFVLVHKPSIIINPYCPQSKNNFADKNIQTNDSYQIVKNQSFNLNIVVFESAGGDKI